MPQTLVRLCITPFHGTAQLCEDLKLTDTPCTVPSLTKASSGHPLNPICAHNPIPSQDSQDNPPTPCFPHVLRLGSTC